MANLGSLALPWWAFVLRGFLVYLVLLLLLRMSGKRSFGEMSAFDVVVLVLVGGTLRTSIIGPDTSFLGALIAVATILATDKALAWVCTRSPRINRLIEGKPTFLVQNGERVPHALRKCNIPEAAFERVLHAHGKEDIHGIYNARLEPNGKVTLTKLN